MKVEDLDVLRPESRFIRIGGKDIDVSFIPCGITFEVDEIVNELMKMNATDVIENIESTHKAFELSIKLCVAFCSHKHPDMDYDWFINNTDVMQVKAFSSAIREALMKAYAGSENENTGESKNAVAAKVKRKR